VPLNFIDRNLFEAREMGGKAAHYVFLCQHCTIPFFTVTQMMTRTALRAWQDTSLNLYLDSHVSRLKTFRTIVA
jgi:hypothetical protein